MKLLLNVYSLIKEKSPSCYAVLDCNQDFKQILDRGLRYIDQMKSDGLLLEEIRIAEDNINFVRRFENDELFYYDKQFNTEGFIKLSDDFEMPCKTWCGYIDLCINGDHSISFECCNKGNVLATQTIAEEDWQYFFIADNNEEEE